ncbi:MAG: hypothetical protein KF838_04345 [Phycisphaeraceae bacterium]|nr:MAG: hypothetical protein KF838_04345 [Phycisphaeraceae bacterium]
MRLITPSELAANVRRDGMIATADFWDSHQKFVEKLYVEGEFWADAVARLKRERRHIEAAAICRNQRPLPAAYRDLLICIRAMIRVSDDQDALFRELYTAAVEATVLHRVPYIEYEVNGHKTGCPGFNAASILFERMAARPVAIDYRQIGYRHVEWLNKTDCIRISQHWGEPATHADPFDLFAEPWQAAIGEWVAAQRRQSDEFRESMSKILRGENDPDRGEVQRKSWLSRLLGR